MEWEHVIPRSRGGSDSVKNATLSCHTCNQEKGSMKLEEWLESINVKPKKTKLDKVRLKGIKAVMNGKVQKNSNRYSAWAGILRRYEENGLFAIFDDVECSTGGKTKYNRTKLNLPKDHHYDALCVGTVPKKRI